LDIDIHSNPLDTIMNNLNDAFNKDNKVVTNENYKRYLESGV
jgi:hypothetical protein